MHRDVILKKYLERKDYYDVFVNVEDDQMFTLEKSSIFGMSIL